MTRSTPEAALRLLILPSDDYSPIYVIAPPNLSGEEAQQVTRRILCDLVSREDAGEWGDEGYSSDDVLAALSAKGFDTLGDQDNVFIGTGWA